MLTNIIENSFDLIICFNQKQNITVMNKAVEQETGYKQADCIGKNLYKVFPPLKNLFATIFEPSSKFVETIEKFNVELIYPFDKQINTFDMRLSPIKDDDNIVGGCLILRKVSEAKQAEINEQVFLVAHEVAHDMREPILTIRLFSELLKKELQDSLFLKETEYLDFIIGGAIRAENFIKEILNGLPGREYQKEAVELNEIMSVAQSNLQRQIREQKTDVVIDYLPEIIGNPTLLTQLFQNLISNLIKLTSSSRLTDLSIQGQECPTCIQIVINVRQLFLTEEEIKKCFKPFFQQDYPLDRRGLRSYIGLSIARKIVDFHDASFEITSDKEKGTTIMLKFEKSDTAPMGLIF